MPFLTRRTASMPARRRSFFPKWNSKRTRSALVEDDEDEEELMTTDEDGPFFDKYTVQVSDAPPSPVMEKTLTEASTPTVVIETAVDISPRVVEPSPPTPALTMVIVEPLPPMKDEPTVSAPKGLDEFLKLTPLKTDLRKDEEGTECESLPFDETPPAALRSKAQAAENEKTEEPQSGPSLVAISSAVIGKASSAAKAAWSWLSETVAGTGENKDDNNPTKKPAEMIVIPNIVPHDFLNRQFAEPCTWHDRTWQDRLNCVREKSLSDTLSTAEEEEEEEEDIQSPKRMHSDLMLDEEDDEDSPLSKRTLEGSPASKNSTDTDDTPRMSDVHFDKNLTREINFEEEGEDDDDDDDYKSFDAASYGCASRWNDLQYERNSRRKAREQEEEDGFTMVMEVQEMMTDCTNFMGCLTETYQETECRPSRDCLTDDSRSRRRNRSSSSRDVSAQYS